MANEEKISQQNKAEVLVGPLQESDLPSADRVFRLAFGTFMGLPDPLSFNATADFVRTRWLADPGSVFGAKSNGELVGSNFLTHWGSFGFFGPLTVTPAYWDQGVGRRLMEATMDRFARWELRHTGLFTFSNSPKHAALYQKFGFWPRYLTAVMSRPVRTTITPVESVLFSELQENERAECEKECRALTNAIYDGLDVTREIGAVCQQKLGDTVLLSNNSGLEAFAVCHCGEGTEAGKDTCYVKFGAVRPGPAAAETFSRMLLACASLASKRSLSRVLTGVNLARHDAYRRMLASGFRTDFQGVAMQRPNESGYNRPDVFVADDWR